MQEALLLTPGPVQVLPEVLQAAANPMTHHDTPEFTALFNETVKRLRGIFQPDGPLFIQNSSGRGAMEASIANLFNPGETIIALTNGRFGKRWAGIARDWQVNVVPVGTDWGLSVHEEELIAALDANSGAKGIIASHCETATGVMTDLSMIGRVARKYGVISVIDAVSSAGGVEIDMRRDGLDVVFSGIQKGFMSPPGLAVTATSERVWKTVEQCRQPRHYFNWLTMRRLADRERPRIFCTPPESLVRSLARALSLIYEEGLANVYARHKALAAAFLAFAEGAGTRLYAKEPHARSPTVSALEMPDGIDAAELLDNMLRVDQVVMAPGQEHLKGKIIRLGHMGPVTPAQLMRGLQSLARALAELGVEKGRAQAGLDGAAGVLG